MNFAILHTTNLYPTPHELIRLGSITELRKNFKKNVIGLSDHSIGNYSSYGAIVLGASIIEKHFTDTFKRVGPDISCSVDEKGLSELIKASKILFKQRLGPKNYLSHKNKSQETLLMPRLFQKKI